MDPNQINHMAGAMAGMIGAILLIGVVIVAFLVFLFWRIFEKAGLTGPLALLILLWPIGLLVDLCILAFSTWKVVPAPQLYPGLQPYPPPPPPNYPPPPPPTSYMPPPPTQL